MALVEQTGEQDAALSLTLAVVAAANSPLMLLDGELKVIAFSTAFCRTFELDGSAATGQQVFDLGGGAWNLPELRALLESTLSGDGSEDTEMSLPRRGREPLRLLAHAERLEYLDLDEVRLLLAVTDLSQAHAAEQEKEELRQRNALLVEEARHRVANSLQIVASVLMQQARRAQSEEVRGHLKNAHHRVMSVAALERRLAGSEEEWVELGPYLEKLCDSIAASMIHDPERVSLHVVADEGRVAAKVSVRLGLITTELVLNAVKYAFPGDRAGVITVRYSVTESGWVLTVSDDGVGFPADTAEVVEGLGTSIVQALATELRAVVLLDGTAPGAAVSIVRSGAAGV
ncbi:sensor histidine kinase [Phenylobacterium sp.]|uniref:sensor histidine kinase n=1 Tax=Phenylobacterium sp. TaxID=1871053 RepID=UPI002F95234C